MEAACTQRVHTIDGALINTAVVALDLRSEPVRANLWKSPQDIKKAADAEAAKKRATKVVVLIAAVLIAAAALWFGVQASTRYLERQRATQQEPPVSTPAEPPATPPPSASASEAAPAAVTPPAPTRSTATREVPTPASPVPATKSPGIAAREGTPKAATEGPFEIVVASFKTESRAAIVLAEVSGLGLPVRQRVSSGWQQVVAGPFASREAAAAAHQRLEQSGHADAKTVPVGR